MIGRGQSSDTISLASMLSPLSGHARERLCPRHRYTNGCVHLVLGAGAFILIFTILAGAFDHISHPIDEPTIPALYAWDKRPGLEHGQRSWWDTTSRPGQVQMLR